MNKKILTLALAVTLPATLTLAQRPGGGPPPPPPGGPPPGQQPADGGGDPRHPHGNRPPKDGGDKNPPPHPPMPLLEVLDADHDGIISADEIKAAPDALKKLDKNKDGKLTPDEYLPPRPDGPPPGGPNGGGNKPPFLGEKPAASGAQKPASPPDGSKPPRPPAPPLVHALDADGDGVISAEEIANAAKALLTLDKNGDGQLGPAEYMGHPPGDGPKPPLPPPANP